MKQVFAVLGVFLSEWPARSLSLLVPAAGAAGTIFIFVSVLAIANGIVDAVDRAGPDSVAIVLHAEAELEHGSRIPDEDLSSISQLISDAALARGARDSIVSLERVQTVDTLSRGGEAGAQVLARGLTSEGVQLRENFRIVEGRMFTPGRREVVVGRRLARDFAGLSIGTTLTGEAHEWSIVGVFEDDGSTAESEVWMDLDSARTESGTRAAISSIRVELPSAAAMGALDEVLRRSPQFQVKVVGARDHQTKQFSQVIARIRLFATGLALMMALGAVVAMVNTMSATIIAREPAVATLASLGFSSAAGGTAVFIETTLLGVLGGGVGAFAAIFVADGFGLSILNGATNTPFALSASVTTKSLAQGVALAGVIGAVAAILPAVSLARVSPTCAGRT